MPHRSCCAASFYSLHCAPAYSCSRTHAHPPRTDGGCWLVDCVSTYERWMLAGGLRLHVRIRWLLADGRCVRGYVLSSEVQHMAHGGALKNRYRIPFTSSVRITATLPHNGIVYYYCRVRWPRTHAHCRFRVRVRVRAGCDGRARTRTAACVGCNHIAPLSHRPHNRACTGHDTSSSGDWESTASKRSAFKAAQELGH